ncbi:porin family protein [Flavihumibacter petaseus]|uniref:Outer membrane protein beta-barrel domain-containing protein n=1 Tax=Flavihumibacter petaseus NBRC 106054 TaxID=1220578 RepID=A0A0E9MYE6_9BACT|nr:porin family protein [Flavihumibacter petaseus]GAO42614.1 hypothetical protein FPE01S_01_16290 [Flavihumibacter petaseus NBRC 106054]
MKNIVTFALAFACLVTVSRAQMVIKPAVGINFTDFSKDASTGKYESKVGYQIGGSIAFGNKWYIEPGIFYVMKSTKYVNEGSTGEDIDFEVGGIRIPVNIGVKLLGDSSGGFGLRAFGGVSSFILTNVKDFDIDDFKKAQWGLQAGVGLDFSILFIEGAYEWSLTDVSSDLDDVDVGKSRSIFVQAGVRLRL